MKYIIGLIIGLILTAFIAYGDSLTYTIAEIQVLLDDIYNRISTSSGASDSGKVIETNASGKVDATFLTSVAGIATVQEGDVSVGGSDIVTMDFDAGVFAITEAPDTEVNVDIQDDGIDSQHYAAGSIDPEHLNIANAETDEYALTYEADTGNFQWVAIPGGGDITTVGLCTTGDCTADFIDSTDMADGDYGDWSFSGGAATLDADVVTSAKIADDQIDSEHYAANSIDNEHMSDNSIDSDDYVDGSIDTAHIAADAIDGTLIADNAINSEHYTDGSIDRVHLDVDVIDATRIEDDAVDSEHYVDASIDPAHLNFVVAPAAGSDEYAVTYEHATGNFELVSMVAGGTVNAIFEATVQVGGSDIVSLDFDAPFTVTEAPDTYITIDIADDGIDSQHYATGSIDTAHIAADQIDATLIADDAIDSEHYTDGSIDLAHLSADSVDGTKIADDAINSEHYAAGSIDLEHMSINSIDSDQYVDASIDLAHLAADSVDGTKIADDAINSEHYTDGSIDAVHLAADVIDETKLANDSLDSEHYNDASIDPAHLNFVAAPAAGNDEYAVTYEHSTGQFELVVLAGGADINEVGLCATGACTDDFIDGTDIVDNAINSEHIAAGAVDLAHMSVNSIDSDQYVDASIDLAHMSINSIDSDQYVDGSIDPAHLNFVVAPGVGTDEYVVSYEHATGNFELVASAGASLGIFDGGVQVGDTDIDKIDLDGTVFAVTEPVDTDILIDIADDGIDSQHYAADSIDDEHINWADITNLSAGGVLNSLGGHVAVGAYEFQSTGNIVMQLGDAAGTNVFEIEDSGGIEVFQVNSDGVINPSSTPSMALYDNDTDSNALVVSGNVDGSNDATVDFDVLINDVEVEMMSLDGAANGGTGEVIFSHPVIPSKGIGIPKTAYTASYDIEATDPTICEKEFIMGSASDADVEFELPASGFCDADSATVRQFYFMNNETGASYVMYLDPNGTDSIQEAGQAVCTNGYKYVCTDGGTFITVIGVGSAGWYVIDHNGNCDCHSE